MKILVVHNRYYYRGGEDTVVDAEGSLLRGHGHQVRLYSRDNNELSHLSRTHTALSTIWSRQTERDVKDICTDFAPDVIHAHNTFPLISPSLYGVAARLQIPVVQTLHNFRLLCPQAMLLRQERVCEACVGHLPWRAVAHRCYRNSYSQSAVTVAMLAAHRLRGTWRKQISRYIVLNQLCRDKFTQGGLPLERMRIKPNFVESVRAPQWEKRQGGMFIGRLSVEKGIGILAQALTHLPEIRIDVFGKGPLQNLVTQSPGLRYGGFQSPAQLTRRLHDAAYVVVPSTGVESFGLVAIEAFACGTPVIATRHGGLAELVVHGKTGLLVAPGDADDLACAISWAEANPAAMLTMGKAAYAEYLTRYTPEHNYDLLVRIYREAIAEILTFRPDKTRYVENRLGR
ncbi:MAG: glycosyltransferase family 4 protein [Burkholderiaceae bacterium]